MFIALFRLVDVHGCCVRSVDESCARTVVATILEKGGMIMLPTIVEGWERIYSNEQRWNKALLRVLREQEATQEEDSWVWSIGKKKNDAQDWPCSKSKRSRE